LIGFFTDDFGDNYFMLVNLYQDKNLTVAQTALDFIIEFDSSIDSIWRLNRLTGEAEEIALVDHILNLTLPGGTGDLFKYDNGFFAGLGVPGDVDGDGDVDLDDFSLMSANMYMNVAGGPADGDFNHDGVVNFNDYVVQALNFGKWPDAEETLSNVPEPAMAALLILAGVLTRRRSR
jgi:hypothetical protein